MSKVYDATLNSLINAHTHDWAAFLLGRAGLPAAPVRVLDTDLSVTQQSDRLFLVEGENPFALHLELEANHALGIPGRLLRYNVLASGDDGLPVHSVLMLLRPKANASDQVGTLTRSVAGAPYLTFQYTVVRVWEESVADLLAAGPGLAPLALLTNEASGDLDGAFARFRDRLQEPDVPRNVAEVLFGETFVLSGLRHDRNRLLDLYRTLNMYLKDSTTYQWIIEQGEAKGELQEARRLTLRLGAERLGPPPETASPALDAIADRERLERIVVRTLRATTWDDLLATP